MAGSQPHTLSPEIIEQVFGFVSNAIDHHFYGWGEKPPIPADAIKQALLEAGGYVQLIEGKHIFLIVTHRNGVLYVHEGIRRCVIKHASEVAEAWDDVYHLDDQRQMIGGDGVGLLVESSLPFESPVPEGDMPTYTIAVLDLTRIDIQPFLQGLMAREPAETA